MGYFIITSRSLIWILLSLLSTLMMFTALLSPAWLTAAPKIATFGNDTVSFIPSVGVYSKCAKPIGLHHPVCTLLGVMGLATDSEIFPTAWKIATVALSLGLTVMTVTVLSGLLGCCVQSIFKKSIFTLSGSGQALAGICYIVGVMLHPMAWGTARVQKLCGRDASAFYMNDCSIGTGLWLAILGTILTFVCACLSVPAEKSTSSDKVQDEIYKGHTLICIK